MSFQTLEAVATRRSVVRVDLLPQEVAAARGGRLLRAGLGAGLVAVVGVACAAYAVTAGHVSTATDALTTEQQRTSQLQTGTTALRGRPEGDGAAADRS